MAESFKNLYNILTHWAKDKTNLGLKSASRVHNILTTVMTRIVVDKSTDHAKPHSISFFLPQYQSYRNKYLS